MWEGLAIHTVSVAQVERGVPSKDLTHINFHTDCLLDLDVL